MTQFALHENDVQAMKVIKTIEIEVPNLGQRIKAARKADSRTLKEICALVGMTTVNWDRIEKEKQTLPLETLRAIEKVLEVDFDVRLEE